MYCITFALVLGLSIVPILNDKHIILSENFKLKLEFMPTKNVQPLDSRP